MNKNVLIAHAIALLATNIAFADQARANPTAVVDPQAKHGHVAYGCFYGPGGEFQGRRDCEGGVVGSCIGTGRDEDSKSNASPSAPMPPATPCAGKVPQGGAGTCSPCNPCNPCAQSGGNTPAQ